MEDLLPQVVGILFGTWCLTWPVIEAIFFDHSPPRRKRFDRVVVYDTELSED